MEEWDWEENSKYNLNPNMLSIKSNKKAFWKCKKGHSWRATIEKRASGRGCPYCSNRKVLKGYNDLATTNKELLNEWDYNKNGELTPETVCAGSTKKAFWICSNCNFSWSTAVRNRTQKRTGCPECGKNKMRSNRQETILKRSKSIANNWVFNEWNHEKNIGIDPQKITYASNKKVWWKCPICSYEWKAVISNRSILGRGCPCCANKVVVVGVNDLATTHPQLAKEWSPKNTITPQEVTVGSGKKVLWNCQRGHEYQASVMHRVHGTNCPKCNSGRQTSFAEQAVFYYIKKLFPDAQNRSKEALEGKYEIDVFIPTIRYAIEYDGIYWHKKAKVKNIETKKYEACKRKNIKLIRIKEGEYNRNIELTADFTFFVSEKRSNEDLKNVIMLLIQKLKSLFIITNSVDINIERDRFEILQELPDIKKKSFEDLYPEIAREWNCEKNKKITPKMFLPHSSQKVWWKCSICGHEWETSIGKRVEGTNCPKCYRKKNKGGGHSLSKKVLQYSANGEFIKEWESVSEAGRELKINPSNISTCALGKRALAGGYIWKYK